MAAQVGKQAPEVINDLARFWRQFRTLYPRHAVFKKYSEDELKYVIPLYVHGDEGRTLQKSAVMVLAWQGALGKSGPAYRFQNKVLYHFS